MEVVRRLQAPRNLRRFGSTNRSRTVLACSWFILIGRPFRLLSTGVVGTSAALLADRQTVDTNPSSSSLPRAASTLFSPQHHREICTYPHKRWYHNVVPPRTSGQPLPSKDPLIPSGSSRSTESVASSTHIRRTMSSDNNNESVGTDAPTSTDEVALAAAAAAIQLEQSGNDTDPPTIFDKIIVGDIPCTKVYEDEMAMAFRDVNPVAPVHVLVIPKQRVGLTQLSKAKVSDHAALIGHLMMVASQVGKKECPNGFRIVINDGKDGAQSVYHLHIHVIGGRQMQWPPG